MVGIIAVLSAVTVPRYQGMLTRYRSDRAAHLLAAEVAAVRTRAKVTGYTLTIEFEPSTDRYRVTGGGRHVEATVLSEPPYRVDLASADFDGTATISFDAYGQPSSGGSVAIEAGGERRTIAVDPDTGRVSMP